MSHATSHNHAQASRTRRGNKNDAEFLTYALKAKAAGYPANEAGVREWLEERLRRRLALRRYQRSDAWALITAHVNTAAPPPVYPTEPRRVPVSHQLPARAASLIRPSLIKAPAIKAESDFIRRFRVAHSNNEAALDALIKEVVA